MTLSTEASQSQTARAPWVAVARSSAVGSKRSLGVRLWGKAYVLFRDDGGRAQGIAGHCPHRAACLAGARVENGAVVCPYHGWRMNGRGACVVIPGELRSSHIKTQEVLHLVEQSGIIWAAPNRVGERPNDAYFCNELGWRRNEQSYSFPAPWTWVLENMIDFSHVPFAHARTAGRGRVASVPVQSLAPTFLGPGETQTGVRSVYRLRNRGLGRDSLPFSIFSHVPGVGDDFTIQVRSTYTWPGYVCNELKLDNGIEYRMHFFLRPETLTSTGLEFVTERNFLTKKIFDWVESRLVRVLFSEDQFIASRTDFSKLQRTQSSRNDAHALAALKLVERRHECLPEAFARQVVRKPSQ